MKKQKTIGAGLQQYASTIWSSADTLRGASFKGSEFPGFMMPFFALMLVESRLLRLRQEIITRQNLDKVLLEAKLELATDPVQYAQQEQQKNTLRLHLELEAQQTGYHPEVGVDGLTLTKMVANATDQFPLRFKAWLEGWDVDTKQLLGVRPAEDDEKYLNISGKSAELAAKNILVPFVRKWSEVDLVALDNSEITTIEEHIKRKWADISAETAGEQYTPSDLIELAVAIHVECQQEAIKADPDRIVSCYDPTCGGGNFVFAMEDALTANFEQVSVISAGQEYNNSLYALAALEARFRPEATIKYGNTLTNDKFAGEQFDFIVANPPYGTAWGDCAEAVNRDESGRFNASRMPSTSDGQLLFLQHIVSHLSPTGSATVVHSGTTLFSGDAGSGESETRRWLLQELDVVEAIIQLPQGLFFNTGISTYLWVLNKNKQADRARKVLLLDASGLGSPLKKNLNKKNCEVSEEGCDRILAELRSFQASDISKVLDVEELLYSKIDIRITRQDEEGRSVTAQEVAGVSMSVECVEGAVSVVYEFDAEGVLQTKLLAADALTSLKESLKQAETVRLTLWNSATREGFSNATVWEWDKETSEVVKKGELLGLGVMAFKPRVAKGRKGAPDTVKMGVAVQPLVEKDEEALSYNKGYHHAESGVRMLEQALVEVVEGPFTVEGAKVGCKINFNKLFGKIGEMRELAEVLEDIEKLEAEIYSCKRMLVPSLSGQFSAL